MKYEFIKANRGCYKATDLCRVLGVSRAGYYDDLKRKTAEPGKREKARQHLSEQIHQIYDLYEGRYGSPRIHATLVEREIRCSLGRVKRIMRREGLAAKIGRKFKPRKCQQTLTDTHNLLHSDDLKHEHVNQVWSSDIT